MKLQQFLGIELPIIQAPQAEKQGSGNFSSLWCGQNAAGCKEIPAAQLPRELASLL